MHCTRMVKVSGAPIGPRRIHPFNVTAHPTAGWAVQQLRLVFPFDHIPRYLLRDRDGIFGSEFRKDVKAMGIQEVLSTPRSPWQSALQHFGPPGALTTPGSWAVVHVSDLFLPCQRVNLVHHRRDLVDLFRVIGIVAVLR